MTGETAAEGRARVAVATTWAVLCALISTGAVVAHLAAGSHDDSIFTFFFADAVVGATFPLVGALVAWKQPGNVTSLVLAAGGLVGWSAASHELVYHAEVVGSGSPFATPAAWLAMWTWAGYWLQPTLLPLLFPDGHLPSRRWRPVLWAVIALLAASALAGAFRPGPVDGIDSPLAQNPLGIGEDDTPFIAVQSIASLLVALPGTAVCIGALLVRRRRTSGRARSQLEWLLLGFGACLLLVVGATVLGSSLPAVRDALFVLAFAAIPASVVVAIWRHQLLGVEIVLRPAAVYSALTGIAGGVYALVVVSAGLAGFGGRVGALGAAVAVLVANAARTRVRSVVDRRLFGLRHDPLAVIALLNETRDTGDAARAVERVVTTVSQALALPLIRVVGASTGETIVGLGRANGATTEIPVTAEGRQLATLIVGLRGRETQFTAPEYTALVTTARRVGAILHADAIARDLQHIREQLVSAREEERRRLRRELHDGVGPSLAGMALQVETLANRLGPETELSERALALREQLQQTAREVRRLVNGLRPAAVDDLGLAEALRHLARLGGEDARVLVRVPDDLPHMPAAVESGAYRIAAEAVANSLRHGRATECTVDVTSDDARLTIEVRDDGAGFGPETASGIGLQSMHERTSELGGELLISSAPGQGTRVVAHLPRRPL